MSNAHAKIAFIGTGVMGGPMAGHLVTAGHTLTVYNRTRAKADAWVAAHGGTARPIRPSAPRGPTPSSPASAMTTILPKSRWAAKARSARCARARVFIDHTTVSAKIARQLAVEGKSLGLHIVDAPVSGGQVGARERHARRSCAADPRRPSRPRRRCSKPMRRGSSMSVAQARDRPPRWSTRSRSGIIQGLAEANPLRTGGKLDLDKVFEAISGGAASSWQMTQSLEDDGEDAIRFRLRRRLDAQGSRPRARRGARQRIGAAGRRRWSTNSMPTCKRRGGHRQDTSSP
jgi:3-hydroxyisobutyrate dehydrogenase